MRGWQEPKPVFFQRKECPVGGQPFSGFTVVGRGPWVCFGIWLRFGFFSFPYPRRRGSPFGEEGKRDPECDTEGDEATEGKREGQGIPKTYVDQF
jgi:hypothetical protein